jgi:hypothetical protein
VPGLKVGIECGQWSRAAAGAAARISAKGWRVQGNKWARKVECGLGELLVVRVGTISGAERGLHRQRQWQMRRRGACSHEEEGMVTFYSQGNGREFPAFAATNKRRGGESARPAQCDRGGFGAYASFAERGALRPPAEGGARDRGAGHAPGQPRGCPMPSTSRPRGRGVRKRARAPEAGASASRHQFKSK